MKWTEKISTEMGRGGARADTALVGYMYCTIRDRGCHSTQHEVTTFLTYNIRDLISRMRALIRMEREDRRVRLI